MSTSGIAAVQSRIASIESRLGIDRPPAATTAGAARSSFDDLLAARTAATSTSSSSGIASIRFGSGTGSGLDGVPYADLFRSAGAAHGVDPALLAAVADAESGFDPNAVSHAGARGLMQLMPATARGLGVTDPTDPAQAIDGAARLLAGNLQRFGSVESALAAYNAGPGAVQRYGGIPPFPETQKYVPKVLERYEELKR